MSGPMPECQDDWLRVMWQSASNFAATQPPGPGVCGRCRKARGRRLVGEQCCTWLGNYRGRHRKAAKR